MDDERRKNSKNLSREMFLRSQGWSALELCTVLDIVGSRILKEDQVHGVDLLLQQTINILRKKPTAWPADAPAVAQDHQPEGAGSASGARPPLSGGGC